MDSTQRMDYLYKEYTRLNEKVEEHIKYSYEDFKFLGAIGAVVILWKPIVDLTALANSRINYSNLLFLGFLSLLLTVAIVCFMNLVKQSYVLFCVSNLQGYEKEIRKILGEVGDAQVFCLNLEKETKFIKTFRLTFGAFAAISALAITCYTVCSFIEFQCSSCFDLSVNGNNDICKLFSGAPKNGKTIF